MTTSLFSNNSKVHGGVIANHIQSSFVDHGDGQAFLRGKSSEELLTYRSGLVKIMANDLSSRAALEPHLEMVNQVGKEKLAVKEKHAKETRFQSFPDFPEEPAFERRSLSFNMAAPAAARVDVADPRPLSQSERADAMVDWAQKEAHKVGKRFPESLIPKLRDQAMYHEPENFQKIVRNLLST